MHIALFTQVLILSYFRKRDGRMSVYPNVVQNYADYTVVARNVMAADFIRIIVGQKDAAASLIEQQLVFCGTEEGKLSTMRSFLKSGALLPPVLVFVQSVERAIELNKQLEGEKVNVDAIHSERTQTARDRILQSFASGEIWVLICTDVLSRGIDFKQVNVVIK